LRAGSVVARPPGTGVAHAFRAGEPGMTLLMYGTRDRVTSASTRARERCTSRAWACSRASASRSTTGTVRTECFSP
jgi:hypothetical protein